MKREQALVRVWDFDRGKSLLMAIPLKTLRYLHWRDVDEVALQYSYVPRLLRFRRQSMKG